VKNKRRGDSAPNEDALSSGSSSFVEGQAPGFETGSSGGRNAQGIEAEIPEAGHRPAEELKRIARSPQSGDAPIKKKKFSPDDIFIYSFCVVGILVSLNIFRIDLFKTLTRQAEEPIGTITFKYKAAQRRFVDRVLWDRLQKESPVYDGDFIRTAELSEATVTFEEGKAVINLPENSLIQLHNDRGDIRVDINEGELGASAEDAPLVLAARESLVTVKTGAVIKAGMEGGDLMLRVMEGAAVFAGPGGTGTVSAGETLALNEAGAQFLREAAALSPRFQARFLSPGPGKFIVPFRWNRDNLPPEAVTRLEVAGDRAFSRIAFSMDFVGDAAAVELDPGTYFWRLSLVNDEGAGPSPNILSFKILSAAAPVLIAPVGGHRYQFRIKRPSVRFQWTETEEADFYMLEAADNPGMVNPALSQAVQGTSFDFTGLGPGTWHWRVRPVFSANYEGAVGEGPPASFTIVQRGDLASPALRIPRNQGMVNIAAGQGDVYFSWRPEAEAGSYRIWISANQDLSDPVIDETVQDNFYAYQVERNVIAPRQYYWAVLQTDVEGNDSALSPAYSFIALEGEAIQRLIFPPDGYVVEAAMLTDMRFVWQTNLPLPMRVQISKDPGFASVFIDEEAGGTAFQGRVLSEGTWHWRIYARDSGGMVFETPSRSFAVAPPIAAPRLLEPDPDKQVFIQGERPQAFSWAASAGADYYQFKVYYGENRNNPIYENNMVEGTREHLSMAGRPEGKYRWTVRGLAPENTRSGRRTGDIAEGVFSARELQRVSLDYPGNNADFEGFRAYYAPAALRWSAGETVGTSRFLLSSRSDFAGSPLALINSPPRRITLPKLAAGVYYWTIRAETPEGYDISAKEPGRFRVLPIPPLPRAANLLPEDGAVIGGADLRAKRSIVFSWDAVAGATGYLFTLVNADTGKTIMRQGPVAETTLTLEDLTLLDVGAFAWQVEAVLAESARERRGDSVTIIQRGEIGENRFTIDFNLPGVPEPREPGILYGRE
jgi:hypothetical protein